MAAPDPVNLLLWTGAVGAAGFLAIVIIEGWSRRGYSAVQHPVSALALGPRGGIQRANFAVSGTAITAGGLGVIGQGTSPMAALGLVVVFFSLPIIATVAVFVLPEWWMRLGSAAMAAWLFVALGNFSRAWEAHSPRAGLAQRAFIVPGWLWLASLLCVLAAG